MDIDIIDLSSIFFHDPMHILLEGIVPCEMSLLIHSPCRRQDFYSVIAGAASRSENKKKYVFMSCQIV